MPLHVHREKGPWEKLRERQLFSVQGDKASEGINPANMGDP